jgi:hypothetical protein
MRLEMPWLAAASSPSGALQDGGVLDGGLLA